MRTIIKNQFEDNQQELIKLNEKQKTSHGLEMTDGHIIFLSKTEIEKKKN